MDEEPPIGLAFDKVYRGPATIPHVPADFFGAFFLAANVRIAAGGRDAGRSRDEAGRRRRSAASVPPLANWVARGPGRGRRGRPRPQSGGIAVGRPGRPAHPNPGATQTVLLAHMFPGKVFGSELRPRKYE
jgi:hypothetical protein